MQRPLSDGRRKKVCAYKRKCVCVCEKERERAREVQRENHLLSRRVTTICMNYNIRPLLSLNCICIQAKNYILKELRSLLCFVWHGSPHTDTHRNCLWELVPFVCDTMRAYLCLHRNAHVAQIEDRWIFWRPQMNANEQK